MISIYRLTCLYLKSYLLVYINYEVALILLRVGMRWSADTKDLGKERKMWIDSDPVVMRVMVAITIRCLREGTIRLIRMQWVNNAIISATNIKLSWILWYCETLLDLSMHCNGGCHNSQRKSISCCETLIRLSHLHSKLDVRFQPKLGHRRLWSDYETFWEGLQTFSYAIISPLS